jgi:dTDP-4-dehydrorhamnose reductase
MSSDGRIIVTGGSGLLGTELRRLLPEADFPSADQFNVEDYEQMVQYCKAGRFRLLFHAAAFTSPPRIDKDPLRAIQTNIIGTANAVRLCALHSAFLVYVSTDYVFRGDRGNYNEDSELYPVNKYAWSKLGGECAVRLYDQSLIIRTSFGPPVFPFPKAFADQWTSRQSVIEIARKMKELIDAKVSGVVHVGGIRRTVLEYAQSLDPSRTIGALSVTDVNFSVPVDTSLDCKKYDHLIQQQDGE